MAGPWEKYAAAAPADQDTGPWTKYQGASQPDAPARPGTQLMAKMDDMARSQGYKDYADQSAKIGHGVMGGQIAALAGPAMSAVKNFLGRGAAAGAPELATAGGAASGAAADAAPAAAESLAPRVSQAGPIRNLPRPGSPLFDAAPASAPATAAPAAAPALAESTGPGAVQAAKEGLLALVKKHPVFSSLLTTGGAAALGPEKIWEAIKASPKMAAAASALGIDGNTFGIPGILASREIAKEATPQSTADAISSMRGERKFALTGLQNVVAHDPSGMDEQTVERAWASPKIKQLLMQASDLQPGSKAMQNVYSQIQAELKGAKP